MRKFYLLLLCCITLFKANSQPGSLDPTFGNKGIQTTAFFSNTDTLNTEGRVVLTNTNGEIFVMVRINDNPISTRIAKYLPNGSPDSSYGNGGYSDAVSNALGSLPVGATFQGDKIVVAGSTNDVAENDFALTRFTADGALDSSFGVNGKVTTDFNNSSDGANSITLQGDKILAAGYAYNSTKHRSDFALARYTADGKLDSSFGVNGKIVTDFGNSVDNANSIALQGDKIVVGGFRTNYDVNKLKRDFVLARYLADGKLDRSFGENGKVITNLTFRGSEDLPLVPYSIALQGNNIIVGGAIGSDFSSFVLERYLVNGTLDNTFGSFGRVTTEFNGADYVNLMALQGDNIVIAAGSSGADFALSRYNADGMLDSSFGVNGKAITDFNNSEDRVNSIALQGDKIILVGHSQKNLALARYTADGKLDSSFGEHGLLIGYFPSTSTNFLCTVMQGNKILTAGSALSDEHNNDFALARYTSDGTLDSSFGVNGKVTTDFNNSNDVAWAIALQGDKIIVGGYTSTSVLYNRDFALARYTSDGTLDSSFGVNGKVITDFGGDDYAISIALQGDKIIVAGTVLARYTADGMLDSSFGENGKVTTSIGGYSIALQENKIIVPGGALNDNKNSDFALVRYTADGVLDSSFGKNGQVITDFNGKTDYAEVIALQGDKIIAAGYTADQYPSYPFNADFGIARYTSDGVLDSSFGVNGKAITNFAANDEVTSIALQGNKIIVGGYTYSSYSSSMVITRYTADGTMDSSFGENGKVITDAGGHAALLGIAVHQNRLYAVGEANLFGSDYGLIAAYQLETPEPEGPAITISDVTVSESRRFAVVTARLSAPTNKTVRVHFTTRDKTAVHNQDYIGVSGPLFFIPGVNTTFKLPIPIINDNQQEDAEQFEIVLSNAHNATIQDSVAVVTIVDDDNAFIAKQNASSLKIEVSPNPSSDAFTIQLLCPDLKERASVRVYDMSGRLIEQRENISIGQSFHLGDQYKAGIYIIKAVQGTQKMQTKVIKVGK